jgi:hypothetical protein
MNQVYCKDLLITFELNGIRIQPNGIRNLAWGTNAHKILEDQWWKGRLIKTMILWICTVEYVQCCEYGTRLLSNGAALHRRLSYFPTLSPRNRHIYREKNI